MYVYDEDDEFYRNPGEAFEVPGSVVLSIKLLRGSTTGVSVYLEPDGGSAVETTMEFAFVSGSYDVYSCDLKIETPGLYWYHFLVKLHGNSWVHVPERPGGAYQITAYSPAVKTPDWIQGGFIYHIFVDRFNKGGELRLRPGSVYRSDWDGCPYYSPDGEGIVRNNDFFGGDLLGIIEKLPYLEELGVTCIYLSPVFDAASNHKYDTGDFMHIDPAFGGDEAFIRLCSEAAERGIRIILDGVFNHVGVDSRYFNKYGNYDSVGAYQDRGSPYYDWFTFRDDGKYDAWWGIELLPAINKTDGSYRDYICSDEGVIAHWTRNGVSGWRLDVVDELPDAFLYPLCEAIKREYSDALIVGEVWEDASNKIAYDVRRRYFLGGQLDSVTNYPLKNAIISFVKDGDAEVLASVMGTLNRNYPKYIRQSLMNILGTHDTARILTVLGADDLPGDKWAMEFFRLDDEQLAIAKKRLRLASLLQFTLPGVPCVFYGDEVGMQGCADPFNRRCYPWGSEDDDLLKWYKKLSFLRKSYKCFTDGKYSLVEARMGLFAFTRGVGDERILIAVNTSDVDRVIPITGFNYSILDDVYIDAPIVKSGEGTVLIWNEE